MQDRRKERYRKLIRWLLVDLAVAAFVFALLLYRPPRYNPVSPPPVGQDPRQVHPYLTHELLPSLYNGAQTGKPFDLAVDEKGLNQTIARLKWPRESQGITFSAPEVLFVPDKIVLMGTADIEGAHFVVTIVLEPKIDPKGLLNIEVDKVKIGAMNITPLVKIVAGKMYQQRLETVPVDTEDIRAKIAAALFDDEPFDPVFKVEDRKVRIERITVTQGKFIARIVPAS